jgi:hypothetical protein
MESRQYFKGRDKGVLLPIKPYVLDLLIPQSTLFAIPRDTLSGLPATFFSSKNSPLASNYLLMHDCSKPIRLGQNPAE